ncbi:MAG TPA: hypothetical protein VG709_00100 [Actinomycetota bacterium]|nr:hypothetical protein [Actinomycetota bacterium]
MAQSRKRAATTSRTEDGSRHDGVCPVAFCPVGMFLTVSGRARPDAVEHLMAAGREFLLALTAVLNARAEDVGRAPAIEKIELE